MAVEGKSGGNQPGLPAVPCPNRRRLFQQSSALLLARQALELRPPGIVGPEERLLAVQDRRVGAVGEFEAVDLAGPQVQLDAPH
jgi:hypothetical protein